MRKDILEALLKQHGDCPLVWLVGRTQVSATLQEVLDGYHEHRRKQDPIYNEKPMECWQCGAVLAKGQGILDKTCRRHDWRCVDRAACDSRADGLMEFRDAVRVPRR